ncbi:MAG: hypothetical protein IKS49_05115 [Actinomycetaceae bacterium]|nr:hypothetical protein [Actinomycetaceae bacterium]
MIDVGVSTPNETRQKTMEVFISLRNYAQENGIAAMHTASEIARERGISEMTLDEINAEIRAARQERRAAN